MFYFSTSKTTDDYLRSFVRLTESNRRKIVSESHLTTLLQQQQQLQQLQQEQFNKSNTQQQQSLLQQAMNEIDRQQQDIPESFDWRTEGFITPVNNQKSCGSCYAFSIAHCVQGQVFKRTGNIIPLSEQQIVDCSVKTGNHGCGGGSLRTTLKYIQQSGGMMREKDYPYVSAVRMVCHIFLAEKIFS